MDYNIHMTKNNHGFTLIELIVTLAVVSIVLVTGIPALNQMTASNRLVAQLNSIAGSLAVARSEAIKTANTVTVCISTDGASCAGSAATNWEQGWIIFTDTNRDNAISVSDADTLLKVQAPFTGGSTLRLSLYDATGLYQFLPDGSSYDRNVDGTAKGTFTLCDSTKDNKKARAININLIGRASRAEGATPTSKPVLDADADEVVCPS